VGSGCVAEVNTIKIFVVFVAFVFFIDTGVVGDGGIWKWMMYLTG